MIRHHTKGVYDKLMSDGFGSQEIGNPSSFIACWKNGARCSQHIVMKNHFSPMYSFQSNRCLFRVNSTTTSQCPPEGGLYIRANAFRPRNWADAPSSSSMRRS